MFLRCEIPVRSPVRFGDTFYRIVLNGKSIFLDQGFHKEFFTSGSIY